MKFVMWWLNGMSNIMFGSVSERNKKAISEGKNKNMSDMSKEAVWSDVMIGCLWSEQMFEFAYVLALRMISIWKWKIWKFCEDFVCYVKMWKIWCFVNM